MFVSMSLIWHIGRPSLPYEKGRPSLIWHIGLSHGRWGDLKDVVGAPGAVRCRRVPQHHALAATRADLREARIEVRHPAAHLQERASLGFSDILI